MKAEQMRNEITKAYPSEKWALKVSKMPINQVIAIYHSLKRSDKLDPIRREARKEPKNKGYQQLTIFDVYGSKVFKKA